MKEHMNQDLIAALENVGVSINRGDVDEVLKVGVDKFLHQRGVDLQVKFLDTIYVILNEMRTR